MADTSDEPTLPLKTPVGLGEGSARRDYEVGYGKPPRQHRFSRGQSGNPKGRKKKDAIDDARFAVENFFAEPVKLREDGRVRNVTKLEALMNAHRINALKGNAKAARSFFKLAQKTGQFSQASRRSGIILTQPGDAEDRLILQAFNAKQQAQANAKRRPK